MKYENIVTGKFLKRPNRFVGIVEINGKKEKVHIKNTGRCKELLLPMATVYLEDFKGRMGTRKMRYSLIAVLKERADGESILINMDSQAPNKVILEALTSNYLDLNGLSKLSKIQSEKTYLNSRFDFYIEDENNEKAYIEVKGVTLEKDGDFMFPDAPTDRGVKHIMELSQIAKKGYRAFIIFVIQMDLKGYFYPNEQTHKEFAESLRYAESQGVNILAYNCSVTEDSMQVNEKLKVVL